MLVECNIGTCLNEQVYITCILAIIKIENNQNIYIKAKQTELLQKKLDKSVCVKGESTVGLIGLQEIEFGFWAKRVGNPQVWDLTPHIKGGVGWGEGAQIFFLYCTHDIKG